MESREETSVSELRGACALRLREAALLIDPERLFRQSMVRAGRGPSAIGVLERIDESMEHLLRADREEERLGLPPPAGSLGETDPRYGFLSLLFAVPTGEARRAAVSFNGLPDRVRKAFFALVICGKTVRQALAEGHGPAEELRANVRTGLEVLRGRDPDRLPRLGSAP